MKIGVFDSGRGGTTILTAVKKYLPGEEYFYIADAENCPYGERTEAELWKIVKGNVEKLLEWGAKVIVIACNTATVKCIERLRAEYPVVKFIGTEPAVRAAVQMGARKILVLATSNTVESERLSELVGDDGAGCEIDVRACPGLAETIERNLGVDESEIDVKLGELLVKDETYDAVVLGCTHYPLVKEKIQKFYPKARMIDSSEGVARRVMAVLYGMEK